MSDPAKIRADSAAMGVSLDDMSDDEVLALVAEPLPARSMPSLADLGVSPQMWGDEPLSVKGPQGSKPLPTTQYDPQLDEFFEATLREQGNVLAHRFTGDLAGGLGSIVDSLAILGRMIKPRAMGGDAPGPFELPALGLRGLGTRATGEIPGSASEALRTLVGLALPAAGFDAPPEEIEGSLPGDVAGGLGSAVPALAAGVAGRTLPAVARILSTWGVAGMQEAAPAYQEAIEAGATEEEAMTAFALSAGIQGGLEVLPVERLLSRVDKASGGGIRRAITTAVTQGMTEGATETMQTAIEGEIARYAWDEEREAVTVADLTRAGVVGALTGTILGGLAGGVETYLAKRAEETTTPPAEGVAEDAVNPSEETASDPIGGVAPGEPVTSFGRRADLTDPVAGPEDLSVPSAAQQVEPSGSPDVGTDAGTDPLTQTSAPNPEQAPEQGKDFDLTGEAVPRGTEAAPPVDPAEPEEIVLPGAEETSETETPPPTEAAYPERDGTPLPEDTTALNKAEIEKIRRDYNLDELDPPRRERFEQTLAAAKQKNLAGGADALARALVANPRPVTAEEHAGMVLRAAELQNTYESLLDEAAEVAESMPARSQELRSRAEAVLDNLNTLTEASDKSGSAIARALSVRRMRMNRETYRLAEVVRRAKLAKRGDLTEQEAERLRSVTSKLADLEGQIAELERQVEEDRAKQDKADAQTFVEEGRRRRRQARTESAVERRERLKAELRALGYRANDVTSSVGLSVEVASLVARLAETYIEEGAATLQEVTDKLETDLPDLTERDIYNALGGRIRKNKKRIETEAKRRLREVKKQARNWAKLLDAVEGQFDKPRVSKDTEEVRALRKILGQMRRRVEQSEYDAAARERIYKQMNRVQDQLAGGFRYIHDKSPEEVQQIQAAIDQLRQRANDAGIDTETVNEQIRDLEQQLLGRKEKRPDSVETAILRQDLNELRRLMRVEETIQDLEEQLRTGDFKVKAPAEQRIIRNAKLDEALIKRRELQRQVDKQIRRMEKKSVFGRSVELALLPRSVMASADLSGALRQGVLLAARHPVIWSKAFSRSLRAAFSQRAADGIDIAIRDHPNHLERLRAKLFLSEMDASPNGREEAFVGELAERIPVVGSIVRGSNRNMVTMLNLLRVGVFDAFIEAHPETTQEERAAYAHWINVATGRGDLGRFASATKELNALFFSPRYAISRVEAPFMALVYRDMPTVRNEIAKDQLAFLLTGMTVLSLASLAGVAEVGDNPDESDFGKMVVGNMRIDIWGGLQQPMRLLWTPIAAGLKRVGVRETSRRVDPVDAALRFGKYKLSPAVSIPAELLTGKDAIGGDVTVTDTMLGAVTPLSIQEVLDVWQGNQDAMKTALAGVLTTMGVGVQEHLPRD